MQPGQVMEDEMSENESFDVNGELGKVIDALPEEGKALLSSFLTPEFGELMGLLLGAPVKDYLNEFIDPSIILVPMERAKVEQEIAGLQQNTAPAGAPAPAAASPASQPSQAQPAGVSQPSGPSMGMLAG